MINICYQFKEKLNLKNKMYVILYNYIQNIIHFKINFVRNLETLQNYVNMTRENLPELSEQAFQISKQLEELASKDYDKADKLLTQVLEKYNKILIASDFYDKIKNSRNNCTQIAKTLEEDYGLPAQKFNWGTQIKQSDPIEHVIANVDTVIVDKPQRHSQTFKHDYYTYRVIVQCTVTNMINNQTNSVYYMTRKRFNDFKQLYQTLSETNICEPPHLPSQKNWYFGGSDIFFIEKRKQELQEWLLACCSITDICQQQCFQDWILADQNTEWRYSAMGIE